MANDEHVALLKQGVDAWNTWRDENPDIRPDLSNADLTGADLRQADLREAHLSRAEDRPCPSGYRESGGFCAPTSDRSAVAVPKRGQCPSGFAQSGNYCLQMRRSAGAWGAAR
jgi:hypothetical protein